MKFQKTLTAKAVAAALLCSHQSFADHADQHIETVDVYGVAIPAAISHADRHSHGIARETGDSLRDLLGVSGARMGGHGIDPSIRGLNQTQLNVLLDGAYVHGGCPNRMDPPTSYATAAAFEEVTVIRGTQTLAYGGGGPGGTIIFKRKTPEFEDGRSVTGNVSGAFRSNSNTSNLAADLAIGDNDRYLRLLANATDADNYRDGSDNTVRSSYQERGYGVIAGFKPSNTSSFTASFDRQETLDALFPGAGMDSPSAVNETLRLSAEASRLGLFQNVSAEVYRSEVDHVMDNFTLRTPGRLQMRAPSSSDTTGGRITADIEASGGTLWKLGLDAQYNDRRARRINETGANPVLNSALWPDVSIEQTGVFTEFTQPVAEQLEIIGGIRYDLVRSVARDTEVDPMGMPMSPDMLYRMYNGGSYDRSRTDHNIGGLLRLEYAPSGTDIKWYVGIARSVRTPDASERYIASNGASPNARWVGNPDLEPEAHHQFEFGGLAQWNTLSVEASLYWNEVSDYVLRDRFVAPGNNASIYRNVDARLVGGELTAQLSLNEHWSAALGAAYVHTTNTTDDRAIAQTQPLEGFARLNWVSGDFAADATLQMAATQSRVDLTSASGINGQGLDVRETPGWGVLNLSANYQLTDAILLEAGIDNALDKTYSQHLNRASAFDPSQIQVNEPGRAVWLGASISF